MIRLPDLIHDDHALILGATHNKDDRSRLTQFSAWLDANQLRWYQPDLEGYRDFLQGRGLRARSVACHLASIRSRYRDILLARDVFFKLVTGQPAMQGREFNEVKAVVDELIERIEAAISPRAAPVKVIQVQDQPDDEARIWLTQAQARLLILRPDKNTLLGKRDRAIIGLLLATGLREAELAHLEVSDLRRTKDGLPALLVRNGKGGKTRLVPYGRQLWILNTLVQEWLEAAGIVSGPVFRGMDRWGTVMRLPISTRSIQRVIGRYPIETREGTLVATPYDLRRTYARSCRQAKMAVEAIQANMGHVSPDQTWHYIGEAKFEDRLTPDIL